MISLLHLGGKFDSEDEDKTSELSAPGVSEFKDDDEFSMKKSPRPNLPRKPSGGGPADFNKAKKTSKPSRKVDLGAAAAFASKAKDDHLQRAAKSENNNQMMDVFFSESDPKPAQMDHEVDDFDPRAGETGIPVTGSSAFGAFSSQASSNKNEGFADFSSAFGPGNTNSAEQDIFGDFGGPQTAPVAAAGLDLFAGMNSASVPSLPPAQTLTAVPAQGNSAASSMDLLGGLDFNSASLPPLAGTQPGLTPVSPLPTTPLQAGPPMGGLAGLGLMNGGPSSLPLQPAASALPSSVANPVSNAAPANNPANVGSTWKDLGRC